MVKVLIIGPGYLGLPLAKSLRRDNHIVWGTARTAAKAKMLASNEIIPVTEGGDDFSAAMSTVESARIDIVVSFAGGPEGGKILSGLAAIGKQRMEVSRKSGHVKPPKLGFVYCSGMWVHGSSTEAINDLLPVGTGEAPTQPGAITAWRPDVERAVMAAADVLDVLIVRPALCYGGTSDIWTILFAPIAAASKAGDSAVNIPADPASIPGLVHVDDVVSGFHLAIEKLELLSGTGVYPVFDLATSYESMAMILTSAAKEMGFTGRVNLTGVPSGSDLTSLFLAGMNTSLRSESGRAKAILGWQPKKTSFLHGMDIYARAWMAANE